MSKGMPWMIMGYHKDFGTVIEPLARIASLRSLVITVPCHAQSLSAFLQLQYLDLEMHNGDRVNLWKHLCPLIDSGSLRRLIIRFYAGPWNFPAVGNTIKRRDVCGTLFMTGPDGQVFTFDFDTLDTIDQKMRES